MNVQDQKLEARIAELQEQLDAGNKRVAELTAELDDLRSGGLSAAESCCGQFKRELSDRAEAAERKLATVHSETIQDCADWITETELALPIAWHMGTKDELVKKFALCLASCLRMEKLDKHCYLCSEETLASAKRVLALGQFEQPQEKKAIRAEDAQTDDRDYAKLAELNRLFSAPAFVRFTDPWLKDDEQLYDIVFPKVQREDGPVTITAPGLIEAQIRRYVDHPYYPGIAMGREMAINRDYILVNAANRGVKCREVLESLQKQCEARGFTVEYGDHGQVTLSEDPKPQRPGEDPPFDACHCPACVTIRAKSRSKP